MGQNYGGQNMGGIPGQQFNDGGFNNRQNIAQMNNPNMGGLAGGG